MRLNVDNFHADQGFRASVVDLFVKEPGVSNERKMLQLLHVVRKADVNKYPLKKQR